VGAPAPVKYHYSYCFFTYLVQRGWAHAQLLALRSPSGGRPGPETLSGGEFGWGGTSVKP
jgi:hypothetical protein